VARSRNFYRETTDGFEAAPPAPRAAEAPQSSVMPPDGRALAPAKASVFDDDFFHRPIEPDADATAAAMPVDPVVEPKAPPYYPPPRVPSFAGYAGSDDSSYSSDDDELDVPAFLRRNR
jgi:hypothetical protein